MSGIINSAGSKSGVIGTTELDYEEGTWTVADPSTLDAGSITLITGTGTQGGNTGYYTKIGNTVYINCPLKVNEVSGGPSGNLQFDLPFTATNQYHSISVFSHSATGSPHGVQGRINFNLASGHIAEFTSGGTQADFGQHMQAGTVVDITGSYRTEA